MSSKPTIVAIRISRRLIACYSLSSARNIVAALQRYFLVLYVYFFGGKGVRNHGGLVSG